MKLNVKLALLLTLLSVIPVLIVGYLSFIDGQKSIQLTSINHLVSTNELKLANFERWVEDNARTLEMLAKSPFFTGEMPRLAPFSETAESEHFQSHDRINSHINPVLDLARLQELFIARATDGKVVFSTRPFQEGKFVDNRTYFIEGKVKTYVQTLYWEMSIQQSSMTIGTPLADSKGRVYAVLAGRLGLSNLSSIIKTISSESLSEDTYLVNDLNYYVTEPRFGKGYALKKSIHTEGVVAALAGQKGVGFYDDYRGVPVIGAYQWLEKWKLCLLTEVDQSEVYAPIYNLRNRILLIALLIAFWAALIGWLSAYTITTPLRNLVVATEQISSENLDTVLDTSVSGEVGDLAQAFDRMVRRLSSTLVSRDLLLTEINNRRREATLKEQAIADLKRSNEELQQFAYVASHDLQEPLRMVSSFTELLSERYGDQIDEKGQKYIHYAVDGAQRMHKLIEGLLAYSRVQTTAKEFTVINSQDVFDTALKNLHIALSQNQVEITSEELPKVKAEATQLCQLFQNLISNGIKFSKGQVIKIHVGVKESDDHWCFSVRDNGIGIEAQYQQRVFEIFQRLNNRASYPGTGIGLAVCKRIVQRHGGDIWYESTLGEGTTFYFTLQKVVEN